MAKLVRLAGLVGFLASAASPSSGADPPAVAIGYCTNDLARAKAVGFDYAELAVRDFARLSEAEFAAFSATHRAVGLPTPVGYLFLPGDLKVVGPNVDDARLDAYVRTAFARAQALGMKIVTFGSGDARRVPEGFAKDKALRQLVAFGGLSIEARTGELERDAPRAIELLRVALKEPLSSPRSTGSAP